MVYHKKNLFQHTLRPDYAGRLCICADQWEAPRLLIRPMRGLVSTQEQCQLYRERKMGIYGHLCFTLSILQKEQVGCFVILYYVSNIDQVSRLRNTLLVWVEQQHRTLSTVKKDRIMSTALITRCCGTHAVYFYHLEIGKFGCKSNRRTKRSGQTDQGWTPCPAP